MVIEAGAKAGLKVIARAGGLTPQAYAYGAIFTRGALRRRQPDWKIVWHVRTGMEVIAPLVGAEVFDFDVATIHGELGGNGIEVELGNDDALDLDSLHAPVRNIEVTCRLGRHMRQVQGRERIGGGGQHRGDFSAHAERQRAKRAEVGAMHVVAEQEHAGFDQADFHGKDVPVSATACVEQLPHLPRLGDAANVASAFHRPLRGDETDLELAIDTVVARDVDRLIVVGGAGGRLDHLLGNAIRSTPRGANSGRSSTTTRPLVVSMTRVFSGSSVRQSAGAAPIRATAASPISPALVRSEPSKRKVVAFRRISPCFFSAALA